MSKPVFYPVLTYRDPAEAIQWLGRAFGFAEHFVARDEAGKPVHVELVFEGGIVMLGAVNPELGMASPAKEPQAAQTIYVAVPDPDVHHDRAKAAGATITMSLRDTDYGSRDYGAQDYEGHRWFFGTYRPEVK